MSTEMYSLLIDAYVKDNQEKNYLFKAIQNIPCIAKKADWAFKWIERCALNPHRNPQPVCSQSLNSSHAPRPETDLDTRSRPTLTAPPTSPSA